MIPEQVNSRVLELFRDTLKNVVPQENLDRIEATTRFDPLTKRWTQVVIMSMLGISCQTNVHTKLFYHPTWWGHTRWLFARCCPTFAGWFRVDWAAEHVDVTTVYRLICPHLPLAKEGQHLQWLSQDAVWAARENVYVNALRQIEVESNRMLEHYPVGAVGRVTIERLRSTAMRALNQTEVK